MQDAENPLRSLLVLRYGDLYSAFVAVVSNDILGDDAFTTEEKDFIRKWAEHGMDELNAKLLK